MAGHAPACRRCARQQIGRGVPSRPRKAGRCAREPRAKGKTDTGRIWVYVRDDKPFGGPAPPGAVFYYSRDRAGKHPQAHLANYTGIFQADAYDGYRKLYEPGRAPGKILEAACWVHARRPFFVMADLAGNARRKAQGNKPAVISPLALEAVRRIDELFEIERAINGETPERRRAVRQELSAPLVANLEAWMREQRAKLSRGNDVAKAMDYMLKRWAAFTRFLGDGRICLSNNAAERGVRGIALGRKSWLFCGSDRGGAGRGDVQPDRHGQDERYRSASLARRRSGAHCRAPGSPARRTASVELARPKQASRSGSLSDRYAAFTGCLLRNARLEAIIFEDATDCGAAAVAGGGRVLALGFDVIEEARDWITLVSVSAPVFSQLRQAYFGRLVTITHTLAGTLSSRLEVSSPMTCSSPPHSTAAPRTDHEECL